MKKKSFSVVLALVLALVAVSSAFAGCETGSETITSGGGNGGTVTGHAVLTQNVVDTDAGAALNATQKKYIFTHNALIVGCKVLGCTADFFFVKSESAFNELIVNNITASEREMYLSMYNEAFFAENNLVLIGLKNSNNNSGDVVELRAIGVKDNELYVIVDKQAGDAADAGYGLFIIAVKKEVFDGETVNVNVVLHGSVGKPTGGGDLLPGPVVQVDQGSGWPESSKLAAYSLAGWNQPAGLGGAAWTENRLADLQYYTLEITFTQVSAATRNSIDSFLEPWSNQTNWMLDDGEVSVTYVRRGEPTRYGVSIYYNMAEGGRIILNRVLESEINPLASIGFMR